MVTSPTTNSSSTKFTLFPNFPPELRIKIWRCAIESRIISYITHVKSFCLKPDRGPPVPALLHTCCEAREVGLQMYDLVSCYEREEPHFYVNPRVDILVFWLSDERRSLLDHELSNTPLLSRIQHIGISRALFIRFANEKNLSEAYTALRTSSCLFQISVLLSAPCAKGISELEIVEDKLDRVGEGKVDNAVTVQIFRDRTRKLVDELMKEGKEKHSEWNWPRIKLADLRDGEKGKH